MPEMSEAHLIECMLQDKPQNYKLAYLVALKAAEAAITRPEIVFGNMLQALNDSDNRNK